MPYGQSLIPAAAGISVSQTVPADFPSDVPIIPGARCQEARKLRDAFTVELTVDEAPLQVVHYYESELARQGWLIERLTDEDKDEYQEAISATKSGHRALVMVEGVSKSVSDVRLVVR